MVTRALIGCALLAAVLTGSIIIGAVNTLARESWPDFGDDD